MPEDAPVMSTVLPVPSNVASTPRGKRESREAACTGTARRATGRRARRRASGAGAHTADVEPAKHDADAIIPRGTVPEGRAARNRDCSWISQKARMDSQKGGFLV
jgi:hypothetical protein